MDTLIQRIEQKKSQLDSSILCHFLRNKGLKPQERLSFIPAMLFFVIGFRDILTYLRNDDSKHPIQQLVNRHCVEDEQHWQWFLEDLQTLGYHYVFLDGPTRFAEHIWAESNWATRNTIYEITHLCKSTRSPLVRLIIIESLEATFEVFNRAMTVLTKEISLFEQLKYFGLCHLHAEENHSFRAGEEDVFAGIDRTEQIQAKIFIERIFDSFESMFAAWYAQRIWVEQEEKMNK